MENNGFNQVDFFSLFNELKTKGSAKLSDHFIKDPGSKQNAENR